MQNAIDEEALKKIFFISERVIVFDGIEDVFQHILKTTVQLTRAEAATIRIFDIKTGTLKIVGSVALSDKFLSQPPLNFGEGVEGRIVKDGKPFSTVDIAKIDDSTHKELIKSEGMHALLCIPLKTKEAVIGCITVYRKTKEVFTDTDLLLLNIFAAQAVEAIEKTRLIEDLKVQATVDSLTGIFNRSFLIKRLEEEIKRTERHGHKLSLVFIDIDGFKNFNDSHGHLLGDKLLADFANILKLNCRKNDIIGRYGGEEFVIGTPEIDKKGAYAVAVKLKNMVSSHKFLGSEGEITNITFSAGIASKTKKGETLEDILHLADGAMYRAKKNGKNRVEMS